MKESWLQANIAPLLALIWTIFTLSIFMLVLTHVITAAENVAFLIINSATNIMMIIVGYFFGSSAGSKAKQLSLDKINDNSTTVSQSVKAKIQE